MTALSGTFLGDLRGRQAAVQAEARDVLRREWSLRAYRDAIDSRQGYSPDLWTKLCALGWAGTTLAESVGGAGASFAELAALLEELGRAVAPTPLASTAVAAFAVERLADAAAATAALKGAASGEAPLTLAVLEHDLHCDSFDVQLTAAADDGGYRLDGAKLFVPYSNIAGATLTVARLKSRDATIFMVDRDAPGISISRMTPLDWSPLFEVRYDGVRVDTGRTLSRSFEPADVLQDVALRGWTATCAEILGVARGALDLAVEYAGARVAFGRPIGTFQAVKHKLVNLLIDIEVAASLVQAAVQDIVTDAPGRRVTAARAAYWCRETLRGVPEGALQVFGGIGFTWEHDIHLYLRRAATLSTLLGEPGMFRDIVVDGLA